MFSKHVLNVVLVVLNLSSTSIIILKEIMQKLNIYIKIHLNKIGLEDE